MRGFLRKAGPALGLPALTLGVLVGVRTLGGTAATVGPAPQEARPAPRPFSAGTGCNSRPSLIGTVVASRVAAHTAPSQASPVVATFHRTNPEGSRQVFRLEGSARGGRWYRALLPVRPDGTTGFVRATALTLSKTRYRIKVDRSAFRLTLWKGCRRAATYPVAVGKPSTPTPAGTFYLASLLRPPDPHSVYGAYAYGLSAYSTVITRWRWGGVVGLHGTNDPSSIGHAVSHGCVRLPNADISRLVRILPLGTPVTIR